MAVRDRSLEGQPDGDHAHVLDAAGDHQVLHAGPDAHCGEAHGLLAGPALAVDGGAGDGLGQARRPPGGAGNVAGLRSEGVDAAEHDVLDGRGVDAGALE